MKMLISEGFPIKEFNGITVNTSLLSNSGNYYNYSSRDVKYIVLHYTGNSSDTAKANANYFNSGSRGASAHYFVDEHNCYQSVALNNAAWAVGGTKTYKHSDCRNLNSISIEMCCSGNYIVSNTTIRNAAYLCVALCKQLGITEKTIDKYILRHYDVWNKSCPAQWANANSAGWTAFKEMVKSILKESEEEPMTTAEKKEFDTLKKQVEELKEKTGYFNYIDKNMNDSYKPTVQKLVNSGKLKGNENGELMLTNDMMRILTILDRCGIFD